MSIVWPTERTCLRCLARQSQRKYPLVIQRHHSRPAPQEDTSEAALRDSIYDPHRPKPRRKDVRITGWRSFLKSKYLGQPASILVLRDAERKRGVPPEYDEEKAKIKVEERELKSVKVSELLASIDAQNRIPGQSEVNQSLEELRPRPRATDEPIVLSLASYEELVNRIVNSFNQLQISRYITIQEGARVVNAQKQAAERKKVPIANKIIGRTDWYGLTRKGEPTPNARAQVIKRGKQGLAEYLVRTLWDVQLAEDHTTLGRVDVRVQQSQFKSLLFGGVDSPLSQLSRRHEVKVDATAESQTIHITAEKASAKDAADAIEDIIAGMYDLEVDLEPLMPRRIRWSNLVHTKLSKDAARDLCTKMGCTMRQSANSKLVTIQALTLERAQQVRRAIFTESGVSSAEKRLLFEVGPESEVQEAWTSVGSGLTSKPVKHQEGFGRVIYPTGISRGRVSGKDHKMSAPISPLTFRKALDYLKAGPNASQATIAPRGQGSAQTINSAELRNHSTAVFGQIRRSQSDPFTHAIDLTSLKRDVAKNYTFTPASIGLTHLLRNRLFFEKPKDQSLIRVQLVPSPWSAPNTPSISQLPHLTLVFSIDQSARRVTYMRTESNRSTRRTGIMLPAIASDVEFTATRRKTDSKPVEDLALRGFIQDVENSGSGYSRVTAPPFVLLMPSLLGPDASTDDTNQADAPFEYFTTSIELVQELTFPLSNADLVYRRIAAGESGGKRDELALIMSTEHPSRTADSSDQPLANGKELQEAFCEEINNILSALDAGAVKASLSMRSQASHNRQDYTVTAND